MQEFSSVTASSYDAESLAPLLNDKAADGWSVVSIVAAGSNVVAYLQREVDESAPSTDDTAAGIGGENAAADESVADENAADESPADESPADNATPAAAAAAMLAAEPAVEDAPAAVEEPAGWAAAPDAAADEATSDDTASADLGAGATAPPAAEPAPEVAEAPAAEAAPAAQAAQPTVPAGWYADPSGRYELRYWDGLAWTEHVSRAGQQFTDPPVA